MKKLHKKFSRVIGLILVMAMMLSVGSVFAEDVKVQPSQILAAINENVQIIEQYIASQGTSTSTVLRKEKQHLESLRLGNQTSEQAERYDGVAGAAVNTMWLAEQYGTITAYPVQIAIYC